MDKIILIGGGGHAKSCIDVIENEKKYEVIGILDSPSKVGEEILGCKIIGSDCDIKKYSDMGYYFLITVGQLETADKRAELFEEVKSAGGKFATVISPLAHIAKGVKIGEGSIVHHGVIINSDSTIGVNCIINSKALIEHDCTVEDNCHIAVGAVLAGGVKIGRGSFIGANATVVQCRNVPQNSFIKACTLVK